MASSGAGHGNGERLGGLELDDELVPGESTVPSDSALMTAIVRRVRRVDAAALSQIDAVIGLYL
jgi:hypothetical protein